MGASTSHNVISLWCLHHRHAWFSTILEFCDPQNCTVRIRSQYHACAHAKLHFAWLQIGPISVCFPSRGSGLQAVLIPAKTLRVSPPISKVNCISLSAVSSIAFVCGRFSHVSSTA
ncbi:hypothetical protein ElyMa_000026300 [Elysia marginata]|uniref:Uncharacterized protein n=1 Tax=Elysia marginata TaxID=1093978 RepID=A0AAV4EC87_9GAST|nr:hypothetical protein ElyMa_000026300 [Elysia marginata]